MRTINKNELKLSWVYWLSISFFIAAFVGSLALTTSSNTSDKKVGAAGVVIFFAFAACGIVWPILRRREQQGIATEFVRTADTHCEAIFFPGSRVKEYLTLTGSGMLAAGAIWMTFIADTLYNQVRGGFGAAFMSGVFFLCLRTLAHGRKGILLLPTGIIWREMFRAPYFIPWEAIAETELFEKKEPNNPNPILTFGIRVTNQDCVKTTSWARATMVRSKVQHGWHLYFFAETICVPLTLVFAAVRLFQGQPEARNEIGTSAGLARVRALENQLN